MSGPRAVVVALSTGLLIAGYVTNDLSRVHFDEEVVSYGWDKTDSENSINYCDIVCLNDSHDSAPQCSQGLHIRNWQGEIDDMCSGGWAYMYFGLAGVVSACLTLLATCSNRPLQEFGFGLISFVCLACSLSAFYGYSHEAVKSYYYDIDSVTEEQGIRLGHSSVFIFVGMLFITAETFYACGQSFADQAKSE